MIDETMGDGTDTEDTGGRPTRWMNYITGSGPTYALVILFLLNAFDELDRTAFAILAPEIRDEFNLGFTGLLTFIAFVTAISLALQVPIAGLADRYNRVHIALVGATAWALFSFATGLATSIVFLAITRAGSGIGKAVNDPTHNSLIADWFDPDHRPKAYSFHRAANAFGAIIGPLAAGFLAYYFGWRAPFFVFAIPTLIVVFFGLRLREPIRGTFERRAAGASEDIVNVEEAPPSYAEAWRMCWKIESLRRIFTAMPFLAASLIGFGQLANLLYEDAYGLDERGRGIVAAVAEPGQLVGLAIGAVVATRLGRRDPGLILKFLAVVAIFCGFLAAIFALVPYLGVAIAAQVLISMSLAIVGPGILASLSLAIPPRARSMGFSMASLWIIPGLIMLPLIGWISDTWGIRLGMLGMVPVFVIGGLVISTASSVIGGDIEQVRASSRARAEALAERRGGRGKLLLCRDLQVSYGNVKVLHDVNFEIDEGEIVALLGTNGAGKSTLLRAISGVVQSSRGAVIFDGRDITHAPPNEIAGHGVVMIPGGQGVFGSLTVEENLDAAGWLHHNDHTALAEAQDRVFEMFGELESRRHDKAANLSGGQQQMLALGMTYLMRPQLLMIDELSLGLAPIVVERLLEMVREIAATGVSIVLVEQSVNVALELAETAYFMERGRMRFNGPTHELMERRDLLRSVFLGDFDDEPSDKALAKPETSDVITLEVQSISRSFGGITAVDNVSFAVHEHEIVGFIGPNGAGKTTLFDLIGGSTPADEGVVT
ncbi:MAG: MFS transporter, partial [Acidobacteria bacterium]|nr:MFS transporter [Acidobacteriota bacterium]